MDQPRSPPPYGPAGVELTQMPEPVPPPMVDMPVPILPQDPVQPGVYPDLNGSTPPDLTPVEGVPLMDQPNNIEPTIESTEGVTYYPLACDDVKVSLEDAPPIDESSDHIPMSHSQELDAKRETLYFRDGKRLIDFVLAYQDTDDARAAKREAFQKNLQNEGLELEMEDRRASQDGKTHFIKIHAPWDVLTKGAELLGMKMPIKEMNDQEKDKGFLYKIPNPFRLSEDLIQPEPDYFTAPFSREKISMFIMSEKQEDFFSKAERSIIVHELLMRTKYDEENDKFGVDHLIRHSVYNKAYPLHEGKYRSSHSLLTVGAENERHLLYEVWARPSRFMFIQPLDNIRYYFGEKMAIYFAWLGFYTAMLVPASVVGLIVFLYGIITIFENTVSNEICDGVERDFVMCPLCDKGCSYWKLSTSCTYSRLTHLFDNNATVFFAAFISIWAATFLEFWKRKQSEIQYDWDMTNYELEEHVRPEFEYKCTKRKVNPITMMMEPFMPFYNRITRRIASVVVVVFMICCVLCAVFGVIMYRIIMATVLAASDDSLIQKNSKITTTATAAFLNLCIILILNRIYQYIAIWLTDLEQPRTDTDYENSFTFKMYAFQFINFYSSIFYIAFFKGRFAGYPGEYRYDLGYRQDECDPAGCLVELCIQLGVVMIGKQAVNNFKEIMLPKICVYMRRYNEEETEDNLYTRWEQDYDLQDQPPMGLFDEYLEMVIQYGFVTIFVAAFPLAPLFALINNVIEIRLDAYKFICQFKRPVALKAQNIGIWYSILEGVSFISVVTNAFIIGWTSDFIPRLVYKYSGSEDQSLVGYVNFSLSVFDVNDFEERSVPKDKKYDVFGNVTHCRYPAYRYPPDHPNAYNYTLEYWHVMCIRLAFILVFVHVVFSALWLVKYLIPDTPSRIRRLMLREHYLAKEARYGFMFRNLGKESEVQANRNSSDEVDTSNCMPTCATPRVAPVNV